MQKVMFIKPQTEKKIFKQSLYFFLLFFLLFPAILPAQDLLIFPKRAVFEGRERVQTFNLNNIGADTATYNLSYLQYRMDENGEFITITEPDSGQFFASPYLRYFPRRVILAPGESQVVKIQLTKTNELVAGREYRSHLYFRSVPIDKPLGENEITEDTTSISIKLTAVYGISIANIIRRGESTTKVSLSNLSFETFNDTIPILKMDFNRTGNFSCYGDFVVNYISPGGETTEVGKIQGFAVYTPRVLRRCKIILKKPEGVDYSKGELRVIYSTQPDVGKTKLAEAELMLK
ncbi:MAG: hypothetical protein JEY97_13770 [Bacteroidales bacterium]|nr:hypothetical protein [Bacteroidales bacterium]